MGWARESDALGQITGDSLQQPCRQDVLSIKHDQPVHGGDEFGGA